MYIVGQEEIDAMARVIRSGALFRYGIGAECDRFERRYAEYLGTSHVALTASGTFALTAAVNALGIGPVDRDLSGAGLRRGYLHGIREVLERLDVRAPHVIWGHSHRSGPWPRDDAAEWTTRAGGRILNTGSWLYQPHFLSAQPNASPYWPGTAVLVEPEGPPRLLRLLGERGHRELQPPG